MQEALFYGDKMPQHIYEATSPPATAPAGVGHHYVDTTAKKMYLAVGTATVADWIEVVNLPVNNSFRVKDGNLQLWNPTQSKWHTIFILGEVDQESIAIGPPET